MLLLKHDSSMPICAAARQMSLGYISQLENDLLVEKDSVDTRLRLLAFYLNRDPGNHLVHALWLINNTPQCNAIGSPFGWVDKNLDTVRYMTLKNAWLDQLGKNPKDLSVLNNAINFLCIRDRAEAIELVGRAKAVDPDNIFWNDLEKFIKSLASHDKGDRRRKQQRTPTN